MRNFKKYLVLGVLIFVMAFFAGCATQPAETPSDGDDDFASNNSLDISGNAYSKKTVLVSDNMLSSSFEECTLETITASTNDGSVSPLVLKNQSATAQTQMEDFLLEYLGGSYSCWIQDDVSIDELPNLEWKDGFDNVSKEQIEALSGVLVTLHFQNIKTQNDIYKMYVINPYGFLSSFEKLGFAEEGPYLRLESKNFISNHDKLLNYMINGYSQKTVLLLARADSSIMEQCSLETITVTAKDGSTAPLVLKNQSIATQQQMEDFLYDYVGGLRVFEHNEDAEKDIVWKEGCEMVSKEHIDALPGILLTLHFQNIKTQNDIYEMYVVSPDGVLSHFMYFGLSDKPYMCEQSIEDAVNYNILLNYLLQSGK